MMILPVMLKLVLPQVHIYLNTQRENIKQYFYICSQFSSFENKGKFWNYVEESFYGYCSQYHWHKTILLYISSLRFKYGKRQWLKSIYWHIRWDKYLVFDTFASWKKCLSPANEFSIKRRNIEARLVAKGYH